MLHYAGDRNILEISKYRNLTWKTHLHQLITLAGSIFAFHTNWMKLFERISINNSLKKCEENDPFLKRMIGVEKWTVYNIKRKDRGSNEANRHKF